MICTVLPKPDLAHLVRTTHAPLNARLHRITAYTRNEQVAVLWR